ncbi:ornithine--oxo-acid transaminase [Burkholderiales bacterium]|nr:ornithine--oxo-acid transaminase [Burkholderiales bacterium]
MTTLARTGLGPGHPPVASAADAAGRAAADSVRRERAYGARNYDPLPVVITRGDGSWLTDVDGRRYLDLMSAYSAVSFGHSHPRIVAALTEQAHRLAVTSRAYFNDRLPLLLERLVALTGLDRALPVNTGLEAVETAIKASRKWAHKVKGVPDGQAGIIACRGNFHGRSIAITGLSTEAQYRDGFGPYPPGLTTIPFDDPAALDAAIGPHTAAFLVEPVQGEAGIVVPHDGYLARCAEICRRHRVLMICDEVQTGLGRTGRLFGWQHDGAMPDGVILGKALGGGLLPVSAFVATDDVMQVFTPGDHGSTFGGNPLGAAVALAALDVLEDERLVARSRELGLWLLDELKGIESPLVVDVRGRGLFIGIEVDAAKATAREVVHRLLARGILTKDTHGTVVRIAPPLNVPREALVWAIGEIRAALEDLEQGVLRVA